MHNQKKVIYILLILIVVSYICTYFLHMPILELLQDTIAAFFQLSIDDTIIKETGNYKHFMKNWEPLIRLFSLILLGNLYIALRRRLSRK